MYGYIYKTTNLINGKIYIGQKKSTEFLGNKYLGSGKYLKCAIQHYGENNFIVELLAIAESKDMLDELEILYIAKYGSTKHSVGYNITAGAVGGDTYSNLSEADKKKRTDKFLSTSKFSTGYKRIHMGDIDKVVPPEKLNEYLIAGWELGMSEKLNKKCVESRKNVKRTVEWNDKIRQSLLSLSCEEKERLRKIHQESAKIQMQNTPKGERIKRARNANKFTGHKCKFVCKGAELHFVYEEEVPKYLENGFILGMKDKRNDEK